MIEIFLKLLNSYVRFLNSFLFIDYDQDIPNWALPIDKSSIFFQRDNIKWGFRKYLEKQIKLIYTNTSFHDDRDALTRVSAIKCIIIVLKCR